MKNSNTPREYCYTLLHATTLPWSDMPKKSTFELTPLPPAGHVDGRLLHSPFEESGAVGPFWRLREAGAAVSTGSAQRASPVPLLLLEASGAAWMDTQATNDGKCAISRKPEALAGIKPGHRCSSIHH